MTPARELLKQSNETTRRRFLATAASAYLGVGVAAGPAASLLRADNAVARPTAKAKHVIYVYLAGGMSHIDTFDPKLGSTKGEFDAIKTNASGVRVTDQLPLLAKHMDKVAVINSMTSSQGAHERGNYLMHTSYAPLGTIRHAAMGSWVLKWAGRKNKTLPGHVVVGGAGRHPGAGFLGSAYAPLHIGNPEAGLSNVNLPRGVDDKKFTRRRSLAERLDRGFRARYPHEQVKAYNRFYEEAVTLMNSEDVKAFDLSGEKAATRDRYGAEDRFGQGLLLARRLVENGVRFVEVNSGGWDTHNENFDRLSDGLLPNLDRGLSALLQDLAERRLLDQTLVVLTTEFGRTPRINERGGRDHYPRAFSAMLAGGGVKGGQAWGKTDKDGAAVVDNEVKAQDFNATIGYAMGLDIKKSAISPEGRPFTMADEGEPVTALF